MTVVVETPLGAPEFFAEHFLPPTRSVEGTDRRYRVYQVEGAGESVRHVDQIDGSLLVAIHVFATSAAANRWIRKSAHRRAGHQQHRREAGA